MSSSEARVAPGRHTAVAPGQCQQVRASGLQQLYVLLLLQLARHRTTWLYKVVAPLLTAAVLVHLRSLLAPEQALASIHAERFLAGSLVASVLICTVQAVAFDVAHGRERGELDYLATFPVGKLNLVLSILLPALVYGIPSWVFLLMVAEPALGVSPRPSLGLIPVLLATSLVLASAGALLGLRLPLRAATTVAMLIPPFLTFLTPMLVTGETAPAWMWALGWASPATPAVELCQALLFSGAPVPVGSALALGAWSAAALFLVAQLPFRGRRGRRRAAGRRPVPREQRT